MTVFKNFVYIRIMNKKHLLVLTIFLFGNMVIFSSVISDLIKDHSTSQIIIRGGLLLLFFVLSLGISFIVLKYIKYSRS